MRKTFAAIALGMMLLGAGAAYADQNPSPTANKKNVPAKEVSPKTADFNIIYVEGAGVILAGVAAAAALRSRRYEE